MKKVHEVIYIAGGVFKTACGLYLDGPAKEHARAVLHKVTCKNCQRAGGAWVRKCCYSEPGLGPHQETCADYRPPVGLL